MINKEIENNEIFGNPEIENTEDEETLRDELTMKSKTEVGELHDTGENVLKSAQEMGVLSEEDRNLLNDLNAEAENAQNKFTAEINEEVISKEKQEYFNSMHEARKDAELRLELFKNELKKHNSDVKKMEDVISSMKSGFIKRIINRKNIKETSLEKNLSSGDVRHSEYRINFEEDAIKRYDEILKEELELKKIVDEKVSIINEEQKREKEESARSVENLAIDNNCFFIHSIAHEGDWEPSENNKQISKGLSFIDKAEIVAGIQPTISASSIRPDSMDGIFGGGRWGVFLRGGRVEGASTTDMGTVATENLDRSGITNTNVEDIEETILRPDSQSDLSKEDYYETDIYEQKKMKERVGGYNEIIVSNPEVSGVYITTSSLEIPSDKDFQNSDKALYDSWWESIEEVKGKGLPVYLLTRNNHVFGIYDIDTEKRTFQVIPEMSPQEVIDRGELTLEDKKEMLERQIHKIN